MPDHDTVSIPVTPEQVTAIQAALKEYEYWRDEDTNSEFCNNEFRDGLRMGAMAAASNIVCRIATGLEPFRQNKPNERKPNEKGNSDH